MEVESTPFRKLLANLEVGKLHYLEGSIRQPMRSNEKHQLCKNCNY